MKTFQTMASAIQSTVTVIAFIILFNTATLFNSYKGVSADTLVPHWFKDTDQPSITNIKQDSNDLVIVTTLDGELHGIQKSTGIKVWTTSLGWGPLVHVSTSTTTDSVCSSKHCNAMDHSHENADASVSDTINQHNGHEESAIRPVPAYSNVKACNGFIIKSSGISDMFLFTSSDGIEKFRLSLKDVVDQRPSFVYRNYAFTSSKYSQIIALDPFTGSIYQTLDSQSGSNSLPNRIPSNALYLTCTKYSLSIFDQQSFKMLGNVSFSEFGTATMPGSDVNDEYDDEGFIDGGSDSSTTNPKPLQIQVDADGFLLIENQSSDTSDTVETKFKTQPVSVFQISTGKSGDTHISKVSLPLPHSYHNRISPGLKKSGNESPDKHHFDNVDDLNDIISDNHQDQYDGYALDQPSSAKSDDKDLDCTLESNFARCFNVHDGKFSNASSSTHLFQFLLFSGITTAIGLIAAAYIFHKQYLNLIAGIWSYTSTHRQSLSSSIPDSLINSLKDVSNSTDSNTQSSSTYVALDDLGFTISKSSELHKAGAILDSISDNRDDDALLAGDETSSNPAEYEHYPLSETSSKSSSWSISQANPSALKVLSVSDTILGYGSHGTIVYKGQFEGREVAIKRLLVDFYEIADHEVKILQESDHHPNVVRYYYREKCDGFMYIALELCSATLQDIIERCSIPQYDEMRRQLKPNHLLREIMAGVQHLHSMKIVHRDLKPQNILISKSNSKKSLKPRILISDFGLGKRLADDQSSFHNTAGFGGGTVGWRAPECLLELANSVGSKNQDSIAGIASMSTQDSLIRITRSMDIFSVGCIFFYILTQGGHPFGDKFVRESNVLRGNYRLDALDALKHESLLAKDMIKRMIAKDPSKRPDAVSLMFHPYFWTSTQKLAFMQELSDRIEIESRDPPSALIKHLERGTTKITGGDWCRRFTRNVMDDLRLRRRYDGSSVQDLLRAVRNTKHHYQELSIESRNSLGVLTEEFVVNLESKFPGLLLHCFNLVTDSKALRNDPTLMSYLTPIG
ncbi:hypothetical protein BDEG_26468 [Batrachochytrium dendrobatidis JEL423]|uniref:non-specific serine/threonine protein kinase n=1 Tax=Batrachochytrium dendrobatidis (strain JEL423) TaxID=403673 RepID=A0A177WSL2_BATDL|nr:hypothetical protein BDEG_26468 [Batrachochytrium dendrobatidis JEL423]